MPKVLVNWDLQKNELQNARIQNLGSAPSDPVAGQIYYNTGDDTFYGWDGDKWLDLGTAGEVTAAEFEDHSERHENDGDDEINVGGLSGELADDQKPKDHNLIDTTKHPVSGLSAGNVIRASAAAAYAFAQLQHDDLGGVGTDDHHDRKHSITDTNDHDNVTAKRIIGRKETTAGVAQELSDSEVRTLINVADGANNYSHPNHTGDVTSVGDGETTIASGAVELSNMANLSQNRLIGRTSAGAGAPEALSAINDTLHGDRGGGSLHSAATTSVNGFMPSADKTKLDNATNLATNNTLVLRDGDGRFRAATPSDDADVAIKSYVDATTTGLDFKQSVRVATTGPITLSEAQTIDTIKLSFGNRVLVKNQSDKKQNGIYVVEEGAWSRASDANTNDKVNPGMFCFVEDGAAHADQGWVLSTTGTIDLGNTELEFTVFSTQGEILAGDGLEKSNNTLNVQGTTNRISVNGTVDIDENYVGQTTITTLGTITTGTWQGTTVAVNQGGTGATTAGGARNNLGAIGKHAEAVGNGSATSIDVTHNLGTRDVTVAVYRNSSPYDQVIVDIEHKDTNNVTVKFATAPTSNEYRVVVTG